MMLSRCRLMLGAGGRGCMLAARRQREWQAEDVLAATMAWLAARRSAVVHKAPCTVLCERRTASFAKNRKGAQINV